MFAAGHHFGRFVVFGAPAERALGIETVLGLLALVGSVVFGTPSVATLTTMVLSAAEGAMQIAPTGVSRVRQKPNLAAAARRDTAAKFRMRGHNRVQSFLVLPNKRLGTIVLMPVVAKIKNFRDSYDKRARFSVKILIERCISLSYLFAATASRGRARIFLCHDKWAKTRSIQTFDYRAGCASCLKSTTRRLDSTLE
jgi:hypothetical protein